MTKADVMRVSLFTPEQIYNLGVENNRLKEQVKSLDKSCKGFLWENGELKAQIEKMKNRCNCKHGEYSCIGPAYFNCKLGLDECKGCKDWGLADD